MLVGFDALNLFFVEVQIVHVDHGTSFYRLLCPPEMILVVLDSFFAHYRTRCFRPTLCISFLRTEIEHFSKKTLFLLVDICVSRQPWVLAMSLLLDWSLCLGLMNSYSYFHIIFRIGGLLLSFPSVTCLTASFHAEHPGSQESRG